MNKIRLLGEGFLEGLLSLLELGVTYVMALLILDYKLDNWLIVLVFVLYEINNKDKFKESNQ